MPTALRGHAEVGPLAPESFPGRTLVRSARNPFRAASPAESFPHSAPMTMPILHRAGRAGPSGAMPTALRGHAPFNPYGRTSVRLARMFLDRRTFGLRPTITRSALDKQVLSAPDGSHATKHVRTVLAPCIRREKHAAAAGQSNLNAPPPTNHTASLSTSGRRKSSDPEQQGHAAAGASPYGRHPLGGTVSGRGPPEDRLR